MAEDPPPKIGIVSLGCAKALVDSERILTRLRAEGYEIAPSYEAADAVLVNTCGFLDSAKAESFSAIAEAMAENGRVIVTGCLGVFAEDIQRRFPKVLAVTGPHQYEAVMAAIHEAVPPRHPPFGELVPPQGIRLTPRHYAYLKISEGCDNACRFCIIPKLRGPLVSRPAGEVLAEAEALAQAGVQELLVVSQDSAAYGRDLKYAPDDWQGRKVASRIADLAAELGNLVPWVRLHYLYPYPHLDQLVALMAEGKILPYLDVPFQHASPQVLAAMRRPAAQEKMLARIENWRKICPDLAIRSTFIVGFPGETEADFAFLVDWLREARLLRVGVFAYEDVAGAAANDLPGAVPWEEREARRDELMAVQQEISAALLAEKVGKTVTVLVDHVDEDGAIARAPWDAPEVDGQVFITDGRHLAPGDRVDVAITDAGAYDLWGQLVSEHSDGEETP